jgi:uncharacterized protein
VTDTSIDYKTIYEHVIRRLKNELPGHLHYHSTAHTLYVLDKATYIGQKEALPRRDLILLKIAALYHDIGFIKGPENHEAIGCTMMEEDLKTWNIPLADIEDIKTIIMATKIPQNPQNHPAMILADADLEYIGTNKYYKMSELLYKELLHRNPKLSEIEWLDIQISFLNSHRFHTRFCKKYKEHRKRKTLNELRSKRKSFPIV